MNSNPHNLLNQYKYIRTLYDGGQITREKFFADVHQLQTQDEQGVWWCVDPGSGNLMRYDGNAWVPEPASTVRPQTRQASSTREKIMPFIGLILSVSCGGLWALYTTLRIGENEPVDCTTPLIMVLIPLGLGFFSKPIDQILNPLYRMRDNFPRPLLIGAAFALPFVLGIVCSSFSSSGYGAIRWTAIISILGAYILTRKQQVIL